MNEQAITAAVNPVPPNPADRRAHVRFRCERAAVGRGFISNTHRSLHARVVDLSVGGIGLVVDEPIEAGTRLNLEFDEATPIEIVAEVKNAVQQPDGTWRCGCVLVFQLSDDEVRFLLK